MADSSGSHAPRSPFRAWQAFIWSMQGLRATWAVESSFRLEVYLFVVLAPLVHVPVTVPVALSADAAFVTTGSYAPNATAAVEMLQFAATDAVTSRFDVAVPASADPPISKDADAMPATARMLRAWKRRFWIMV